MDYPRRRCPWLSRGGLNCCSSPKSPPATGRNGVGKTTLLQPVAGFVQPRTGSVLLDGRALAGMPPYRIARHEVCYVAQEQALFTDMTVSENLRLGVPGDRLSRQRLPMMSRTFPRCSTA